jgi:DoxX-like protein
MIAFPPLSHLPGFPRHYYDGLLQKNVTAGNRHKEEENNLKLKSTSYWVVTAMVAFFIGSGGAAELARVPGTVEGLVQLGYPVYFATIIGFWKVLGSIAILVPGFPRLKEWAYAGIFFNMTGAAATGVFVGAAAWHVIVDLVLTALTIASWALRPASRRLEGPIL